MKKIFKSLIPIVGLIVFMLTMIFPDAMGMAPGVIGATTFITATVTWSGKENYDYFLRPMFVGKSPWETQGIRVIPNCLSSQKMNYFGTAQKILKAYAVGFHPAVGSAHTQRTLSTVRLKAEASEDANDFYNTVFEAGLRKDDWNNLDGTALKQIIIDLYKNALAADIYRIFWLADPYKETVTTTYQTGTADVDYNALTGMWKLIFANAATSPSDTQIKRIAVTDGAIAQVQTVTLSGGNTTGYQANVLVDGVNYLLTYDTSYDQTITNGIALHAAALLLRGFVMAAGSTGTFTLTSVYPGRPFAPVTITQVGTGLTGSVAATTANTAPSALSAGESEDTFNSLFNTCDVVLKNIPANEKVLLVDRLVYENYQDYLETLATVVQNSKLENGVSMLTYRGIPVIPMEWSLYTTADFAHLSTVLPFYPHRCIYTQIGNLVLGIDSMNQFNGTTMWYDLNTETNRFRSKLVMGVQYVHNKLMAVAY